MLGTEDWIGFDTVGKIFGGGDAPELPPEPSRKQKRRDAQWARSQAVKEQIRGIYQGRAAQASATTMLTVGGIVLAGGIVWLLSRRKK